MTPGGDGLSQTCSRCGHEMGGERSGKSHRFLFAAIAAAYQNWPESHNFRPTSAEHLRAWLFAHPAVEFCGTVEANPGNVRKIRALALALRNEGLRLFFDATPGGDILLRVPRTSSFVSSGGPKRGEFNGLVDRVLAAIEQETGITQDDLRREAAAANVRKAGLGKRRAA